MLTHYGLPFLVRLHGVTFKAWCKLGAFENYLYEWRKLFEAACPCGDCG